MAFSEPLDIIFGPPFGVAFQRFGEGYAERRCILNRPGSVDSEEQLVISEWSVVVPTQDWVDEEDNETLDAGMLVLVDGKRFKTTGSMVRVAPDGVTSVIPITPC